MNEIGISLDDEAGETFVITDEMSKEEQTLKIINDAEMERKRREYKAQQHEGELKERRYRSLLNLLEKSQFYANFVQEELQGGLKELKENQKPKGKRGKRKACQFDKEQCENLNAVCNKMKKRKNEWSYSDSVDLKESQLSEKDSLGKDEEVETKLTSLGIEVPVDQPDLLEGGALRDYQLYGFKWLKMLFEGGINGILADEMGLGKTLQAIALICHLYEQGVPGPYLIIGPLSTLPNWSIEFKTFAPKIPVVVYHGKLSERAELKSQLTKMTDVGGRKAAPVVLTSYQIPLFDQKVLSQIEWKFLIVDEGHRLKNSETALYRVLQTFQTGNRLLLTGTPFQNNLMELWSLLHFLIPDIFDNPDTFHSWFEVEDMQHSDVTNLVIKEEKERNILTLLHQILSPFLLRRIKADLNINLPGKKEVHVLCPMMKFQRQIYEAILNSALLNANEKPIKSLIIPNNPNGTKKKRMAAVRANFKGYKDKLNEKDLTELYPPISAKEVSYEEESIWMKIKHKGVIYSIMAKMTMPTVALKRVANHPVLVTKVYSIDDEVGKRMLEGKDEELVNSSGKLIVLNKLLAKLKERGHKVLIFSTWVSILNIIEDMVSEQDLKYCYLDGSTSVGDRKDAIHAFNTDPNIFLFLLSTRAGGLGINLTAADTVILFDSDWNPQADLQAQDRSHRIGQLKPVVVYRLITAGSIDEKIVATAYAKRKLEKMVIDQGKFGGTRKPVRDGENLEELKELLSKKHHNLLIQADGNTGELCEQEWERLLDRSDLATRI